MSKPIVDRPEPSGFDHGDPGLAAHMHETLAELRSTCPVGWSDSFDGFWTLTRYDDVVGAARDHTVFTTTQGIMIPPTGASMRLVPAEFDPPEHTTYRKMVMPFFKAGTVDALDDMIRGAVRECFDAFVGAGAADLVTALADPVPPMVLSRYLGLEESKAHEMRVLMTNYLSSARVSHDEKVAAATAFESFVQKQIDERIADPGNDRLSQIVRTAVEDHGLSPLETLGMVRLIISAGHETTVHGIGSLCYRVLAEPGVKDRLLDDLTLRKTAVNEALRLDPPVMHMARTVVGDHELRDQALRAGDKVMLCFGAANRDGERFTDPDEFRLDRGQIADVTFGNGRHRCLGEHLAIAELRAVLDELLLRIPDARIADGAQIEWTGGGNTRGVASLPIVFTPAD
jgi:cytochrome P450